MERLRVWMREEKELEKEREVALCSMSEHASVRKDVSV